MKIVHVMVSPFTEGMTYQDNLLPEAQKKNGHDVTFITSCKAWDGKNLIEVQPCDTGMENGVRLIRLKMKTILGSKLLSDKVRYLKELENYLNELLPDFIMLHGPQTASTKIICKYIDAHPKARFVIDSHADSHNSATNFVSKYILHHLYYRYYVNMALKYAERFYYVAPEVKTFILNNYKIKEDKLELLPLGGVILDDEEYKSIRSKRRYELGFSKDEIVFIHTGKITAEKRTKLLLKAFEKVNNPRAKLIIIGSPESDIKTAIKSAEKGNKNIVFLGWKAGNDLREYLCAADVYAQPGTQSATLQNAICARCAIMVYPYPSHEILMKENGYYVKDEKEILEAINEICENPSNLKKMQSASQLLAENLLDYTMQAEKVLEIKVEQKT